MTDRLSPSVYRLGPIRILRLIPRARALRERESWTHELRRTQLGKSITIQALSKESAEHEPTTKDGRL